MKIIYRIVNMRKFRYNIQFKDRANRVADIITAKPEDVEKLLQQLLNDFEKTNKQLADIATFHAAYRFNITSRQGNNFYVTEIKEVDLSSGYTSFSMASWIRRC